MKLDNHNQYLSTKKAMVEIVNEMFRKNDDESS